MTSDQAIDYLEDMRRACNRFCPSPDDRDALGYAIAAILRNKILQGIIDNQAKEIERRFDRDDLRAQLEAEKQSNREWEELSSLLRFDLERMGLGVNPKWVISRLNELDPRNKPAAREKIGQEW